LVHVRRRYRAHSEIAITTFKGLNRALRSRQRSNARGVGRKKP
jgi:hypothetical protein